MRILGFDRDETHRCKVVTAYEPSNPGWWKKYARAKGLDDS